MSDWKDKLRRVAPYVPGEQPKAADIVKLNTNENPYPPAPGVREVLAWFDTEKLRKYPDPDSVELREALAQYHGVKKEQVFVGVGSDDVLGMAFLTCFNSDEPVLFPDITYSFYDVWCRLFGIKYETRKLDNNFRIVKEEYYGGNGGVVIANPNAPTSIAMELADIEDIIKNNPDSVVIIDEAYIDFGGQTALPLLDKYDNLLIVRTFSKSRSMAGVRIGYAMGSEELVSALFAVKNSYNSYTISSLSSASGIASIEDDVYFNERLESIIATRRRAINMLKELGFTMPDSRTNFLFAEHLSIPARILFQELKNRRIYVRYFDKPRIDNRLRISIGTDEEMEKLINALERIIAKYA